MARHSLSNKRFRLVLEQRKTEGREFWFWPREKWNKSTLVPFSSLQNRTEMLATQVRQDMAVYLLHVRTKDNLIIHSFIPSHKLTEHSLAGKLLWLNVTKGKALKYMMSASNEKWDTAKEFE